MMGVLAANALDDYDVQVCTVDLGGKSMNRELLAFEAASAVAGLILRGEVQHPRLLVGFSIAGWMCWFIDRLLVAAGRDPTPIVNVDGGAFHLGRADRVERFAHLLPPDGAPPFRMLLVHRGQPGRFQCSPRLDADWIIPGGLVHCLPLRTVDHDDPARLEAIVGYRSALERFMENPDRGCGEGRTVVLSSRGGTLFEMLDAPTRPSPAQVGELLAGSPSGVTDPETRTPLLFLALCTGEAEFALDTARRLAAADTTFRQAAYAEVAVLAEMGRNAEAAARARSLPLDQRLQARAARRASGPESWAVGPPLNLHGDSAMDFAASFLVP